MELILLGLLGAAGLYGLTELFDGSAPDSSTPDTPDDTDTDTEEADTGVTVVTDPAGNVNIELGEDETGRLVALKFHRTAAGENYDEVYHLGLYLVPEDVQIPIDPTGAAFGTEGQTLPEELFKSLGLQELARFDLGTYPDTDENTGNTNAEDTRTEPPQITSGSPIEIIRVIYEYGDGGPTDGVSIRTEEDETLSPFEERGRFFGGVEAQEGTGNFSGTEETDFHYVLGSETGTAVLMAGNGGADQLVTTRAGSTLTGGAGDDALYALADAVSVDGGAGDDRLYAGSNGTVSGGEGDDTLASSQTFMHYTEQNVLPEGAVQLSTPDRSALSGGAGDDDLYLYGESTGEGEAGSDELVAYDSASAYGGYGQDTLTLHDSATGRGGAGDDRINVEDSARAYGGSGEDTLSVSRFYSDLPDSTPVLTGGADADTFTFEVRNLYEPLTGQSHQIARITDFNAGEDVIVVQTGYATELTGARTEEAADGSYTDLVIELRSTLGGQTNPNGEMTIRLDGVTGLSAQELLATVKTAA